MNPAYVLAAKDLGTWEWKEGHNPKVVKYFSDVGHSWVKDDETAWCAAFVGAMLKRAGLPHTGKLNARSYMEWGEPVDFADAQEGDVIILWRGTRNGMFGHVGFFVKEDHEGVQILGGNQSNQVNISTYAHDRVIAIRRAPGNVSPTPVKIITSKVRSTPLKSKTILGSASQILGGFTGGIAALRSLDGLAQILVIAGILALSGFALWLIKDRLKRWAEGEQ